MNTRVEHKSGEELVNIISENVGRMLRRKMDAVTCIRIAAEEAAENWDPSVVDGNFSYVAKYALILITTCVINDRKHLWNKYAESINIFSKITVEL